jgi:formate/nitrite transporter FocA (FNT family)
MMLGAKVSIAEFAIWNLIPVTLGNLVGGFGFVALALFATFARKPSEASPSALPRHAES